MKLDTTPQDVAVAGNFETSAFGMEASAHAFDIIADKIYTHKVRAVIREISCNAHDAHVEAGNPDPFDVHIPTQLEPWFSVRDYGVGLSDDDVRFVFCNTFKSTKQNTNSQIGCLGLGSKSPFCLADSFTVKSWHRGVCRTYSCYRDDQRKPNVALLTELPSDAPNGIEVSLSIEDKATEFESDAIEVYRYWDYTPNINNKLVIAECQEARERYIFKGDDFGLTSSYGSMKAIMGNVAYDIPDELDQFDTDGYLRFNLGEVSFDAGRESLSLDDRTKQAIKDKFKTVKAKIAATAVDQIKEEPTAFRRAQVADQLSNGQLGRHIKVDLSEFELPKPTEPIRYFHSRWRSVDVDTSKTVPVGGNIEYYEFKPRMQTRIRSYVRDSYQLTLVVLMPRQIIECKVDPDVVKNLDDLPKVERQSYSVGSTVKTFTYNDPDRWWGKDRSYWEENELEIDGDEMVYVEINRWEPQGKKSGIDYCNRDIRETRELLKGVGIDVPVIHGLKTAYLKTKAFKTGNWIGFYDYVLREVGKIAPESRYSYEQHQYDIMKTLDENTRGCAELKDWHELQKGSKNSTTTQLCTKVGIELKEDHKLQDFHDAFFEQYPILTMLADYEIKRNVDKIAPYIGATIYKRGSKKC